MKIFEDFKNRLISKNKSPETVKNYELDLKCWRLYQFKNKEEITNSDLRDVTFEELTEYICFLTDENKSSATIARKISSIRSFFEYITTVRRITKENTAKYLEIPTKTRKIPKYLDTAEAINLLREVSKAKRNKERDFAIITLFLNLGLRLSELINIDINKIRKDKLQITRKGDKEAILILNQQCLDAISSYLKVRQSDEPALFLGSDKTRIDKQAVQKMVKKYLDKINRGDLSVHKLRHTAASIWLESGGTLFDIKELLGHTDIATTQIYAHMTNNRMHDLMNNTTLTKNYNI